MDILDLYLDAWKRRDGALVSSLDYIIDEQDVLDALSGKKRRVYEMYIGVRDGVSYFEISQSLDISPQNVAVFCFRLRKNGFALPVGKSLYNHDRLLKDALSFQYFPSELAEKYHMSRQGVDQILRRKGGFTPKGLTLAIKQTQQELFVPFQKLVDILQQYYFDRLIEENGLDHALAWRVQECYGSGKTFSLETLESFSALFFPGIFSL